MKACTCGQDCGFNRGDLVCDYCGVPYEYARSPIGMSQTAMSYHNRIRMICGICENYFREQARKKDHPVPIPRASWMLPK